MATPKLPSANSVIDFLNSRGQDSSFRARRKMFRDAGMENRLGKFVGSSRQNLALLEQLRSGGSPRNPSFFSGEAPPNAQEGEARRPSFYSGEAPPNALEGSRSPSFFGNQAPPNAFEAAGIAGSQVLRVPPYDGPRTLRIPGYQPTPTAEPNTLRVPSQMPTASAPARTGQGTQDLEMPRRQRAPRTAPTPEPGDLRVTRPTTASTPAQSTARSLFNRAASRAATPALQTARFLTANPALGGATMFGVPAAADAYQAITGGVEQTFEDEATRQANTTAQTRRVGAPPPVVDRTVRISAPVDDNTAGGGAGGGGGGSFGPTNNEPAETGMTRSEAQQAIADSGLFNSPTMQPFLQAITAANANADANANQFGFASDQGGMTGTTPTTRVDDRFAPNQGTGGAAAPEVDPATVNAADTQLGQINEEIAQYRRNGQQPPAELLANAANQMGVSLNAANMAMAEASMAQREAQAMQQTGIAGSEAAPEGTPTEEIDLVNEWLTSAEGQLAVDRYKKEGLDAESAQQQAYADAQAQHDEKKTQVEQQLTERGLAFSGIRGSQVAALAQNLAASQLGADRKLASMLIDADINFREKVLSGVADLIENAEKDDAKAISQLNKMGYAVYNGELQPTLSLQREMRMAETPDLTIQTNRAGQVTAINKDTGEVVWRTEAGVGRSGSAGGPDIRVRTLSDPTTGAPIIETINEDTGEVVYRSADGSVIPPDVVRTGEGQDATDELVDLYMNMFKKDGIF